MVSWQFGMRLAVAAILLGPPGSLAQDPAPRLEMAQAAAPDEPLDREPLSESGAPADGALPAANTNASDTAGGTLSVDAMIAGLAALNITYSVDETVVREWLANADYTPYPAVASRLIAFLHGRRLANPLDLDVIVFDYENTPNIQSPRKIEDVQEAVLSAALLKGYNARYSASARVLSDIVK